MTKNYEVNDADQEAIGIMIAINLKLGWHVDNSMLVALSPAYWEYQYVPQAELLLVPTGASHGRVRLDVMGACREARCDAIILSAGQTSDGARQTYATVIRWSSNGARWHGPHLPWLSASGDQLWLTPDPRALAADEPAFSLDLLGLSDTAAPYTDALDQDRGLTAARAFIDQALGG
ncbi:hypothetical protein SAMN06297144_1425 [Sphingomonas guangdongensis]|uniref:Uncharacterized protein n=1 Tax=Sphingomonas guangdongensis TaxID=1141890 RepID=A0A285QM34_9SPHN|nr:hypothetical protein [Sphingomonas guangdongensis]SOB81152.1 hypothetical protein SAMN06297144_1425 [Sphingomonas guangdongensis]